MRRGAVLLVMLCSLAPALTLALTWSDLRAPAPGHPQAIGSYAAGCLQGAVALPPQGPGFQVMRRARQRFFGHPALVSYVQQLGLAVARRGLGVLLIGDLGQARGGPMSSGHRSHQNGLDADIWFWLPSDVATLTAVDGEAAQAPSMLAADGGGLDAWQWSSRQAEVLTLAAAFEEVARIFVNPVIKRSLCTQSPAAPWLHKLRPWWGHADHFHVRLHCPPGAAACHEQEAPPSGDGCGAELAWWFTDEARATPPVPPTKVPLPASCEAILRR